MGCAGVIGWNREKEGHFAGFRTNILVGMSAALFTSCGDLIIVYFAKYGPTIHVEPLRILQSIVLGISFLGSGIIFVSRHADEVRGLTTAATIWAITGVGIVAGLNHFLLAAEITALVFLVLQLGRWLEQSFSGRK